MPRISLIICLHLTVVLPLVTPARACHGSIANSAPTGTVFASGFDMTRSWGQLSPYNGAISFGATPGVPETCQLSQAHGLYRHTERYPTSYYLEGGETEAFWSQVEAYRKAHPNGTIATGPLSFLNHWQYMFGEVDVLLPSGTATAQSAGASFWSQYGRLVYRAGPNVPSWNASLNVASNGTARPKPVFRTTTESRILESARWWLSGFFGDNKAGSSVDQYDLVVIPEAEGYNNTLASFNACVGDMTEGANSTDHFIPIFTEDARNRLSGFMSSGFNLTSSHVFAMMSLCSYEFAALGGSRFCSLFTEQEWEDYEYAADLQFYGGYGFGAPSGRAQGIGYVVELGARLEGRLVHKGDVGINYTYDNTEASFPLHQPVYMDMAHDTTIISVLTALGLNTFKEPNGLSAAVEHSPPHRFRVSEITPFGARLIFEVWTCQNDTNFNDLSPVLYTNPDLSSAQNTSNYIRLVLNGAPVSLDGLSGCLRAVNGFCRLGSFLGDIPKLKEQAQYDFACGGNYTRGKQVADGTPEEEL